MPAAAAAADDDDDQESKRNLSTSKIHNSFKIFLHVS